jgi:hypothetical protein
MWLNDGTALGVQSNKNVRFELIPYTAGNLHEVLSDPPVIRGIEIGGAPAPTFPHFYVVDDGSLDQYFEQYGFGPHQCNWQC